MATEENKNAKRLLIIRSDATYFRAVAEQLKEIGFQYMADVPSYVVQDGGAVFCGEIDDQRISDVEAIPHIFGVTVWGGLLDQGQWTEELEKLGRKHTAGFIEYLDVMNQTIVDDAERGDVSYSMPIAVFLFILFSMNKGLFMEFANEKWEQTIRQCYENIEKNILTISVPMDVVVLAFEGFWVAHDEALLDIENEILGTVADSVRKIPLGTIIH
ncbi:MAG: hypothetical protein Q8O83_00495 [bacterium]|nr:hypothetical protein [bacterium]